MDKKTHMHLSVNLPATEDTSDHMIYEFVIYSPFVLKV